MIDDSIVRGTTVARLVKILRDAGAKEVHMRVSAPPFMWPCYYGTDVPSKDKLIACKYDTVEEIAKAVGVDSLGYLGINRLKELTLGKDLSYCEACFTGKYPMGKPKEDEEALSNAVEIRKSPKFTIQ